MAENFEEKKSIPGWIKAIMITICAVTVVLLIALAFVVHKWQRATVLTADMFRAGEQGAISVYKVNELDESNGRDTADKYKDGTTITFGGRKYRYNDNLINILVMGIDDYGLKGEAGDANPYQADTIVLGTVDALKKTVSFMSIPRDTVTTIKVLDLNDEVATKRKGPIAIQHSFGSQGEKTDEAVAQAVSDLLYGVPIYRYVAVDISAIPNINDELGGIRVDITEDLTKWNPDMKEGTGDYLLKGNDAIVFVARRDTAIDDSAMGRMKRQVQYMKKLFPAMKEKTRGNLTFPIMLYNKEEGKVDTNLSIDEMTYLAKIMLDLEMDENNIVSVPGEMKHIEPGEIEDYEFEMGYIVDEDALKQLVVDRFYVPVDE